MRELGFSRGSRSRASIPPALPRDPLQTPNWSLQRSLAGQQDGTQPLNVVLAGVEERWWGSAGGGGCVGGGGMHTIVVLCTRHMLPKRILSRSEAELSATLKHGSTHISATFDAFWPLESPEHPQNLRTGQACGWIPDVVAKGHCKLGPLGWKKMGQNVSLKQASDPF